MATRILLVGGGSGGHVYPLVAVARALQAEAAARGKKVKLLLMGDGPYIARAAADVGLPYTTIIAPKLRRYTSIKNFTDIFKVPLALAQSFWKLFWFMPDAVFSKGGYTAVFPTIAARWYLIPVYLHESDSVPGLANKMLAKRARLIFTAFPGADQAFAASKRPTMLVGNPFRAQLAGVDRAAAHQALKLDPAKKTILVIGGSQGAQQLNQLVLNGLVEMIQKGYNIIHQTGDTNFDDVKKTVEQYATGTHAAYGPLIAAQYRVYPFFDQAGLATAYGACDVAVSRASASVLTELAYLGKPIIAVPLPGSANNHQQENAADLTRYGAVTVDGDNATPAILLQQIEILLQPTKAAEVSASIRAFAHPDAAQKIAAVLLG